MNVLVLLNGEKMRSRAKIMPLKQALSLSPMDNGQFFKPLTNPKQKNAGTALCMGQQHTDTSRNRDKTQDCFNDLAGVDVDVHPNEGDPLIDHAKMWEAAKKLGFIAYQPSNSGTGLHFLCEIKGRGDAFNKMLAGNAKNHDAASRVYNQIYIDFINEITPALLEGQAESVQKYYLHRGVKTGNHGQRYGLCDPELKSINRLVYLTGHKWLWNENNHPFIFSTQNTEQRCSSEIGRMTAQGASQAEIMHVLGATVPDFKPDNAQRLIEKNKANPRWKGFKCLDIMENEDAAINCGLAKIQECFEIGKIGGKVFIRKKGSVCDPDDLKDCHDLKAAVYYRDGDKVKPITLKAILDSADGINYINQFPEIIATYGKQIDGGINLCPPLPKYEYKITDNANFIADYLLHKSNAWPYAAKAFLRALERPADATQAVIYMYEPIGGKGKSTTMECIISKLGVLTSEITLNANNKYSNDMPKSKIWYLAEGVFNLEDQAILSNIKKWSGDKSFSLDIKYGSIAHCENCPLIVVTCNEIERVPLKLITDRRTIALKYNDTGTEYRELKRRMHTFTPSDVYSALTILANQCEKDYKVGNADNMPAVLFENTKQAVQACFQCSRVGQGLLANDTITDIQNATRCSLSTITTYQEIGHRYGLLENNGLRYVMSQRFLDKASQVRGDENVSTMAKEFDRTFNFLDVKDTLF